MVLRWWLWMGISLYLGFVKSDENIKDKLIEHLFKSYSKTMPSRKGPTEIKLGIYVNSIVSNDMDMNLKINGYFRQSWKDENLRFEEDIVKSWNDTELSEVKFDDIPEKIRLPTEYVKNKVFVPDIFFRNGDSTALDPDDMSDHNTLMIVSKDGSVWFVRHLVPTFACPMKIQKFPMDTQSCPIIFESFGNTMDTLHFGWMKNPIQFDPSITLLKFTIKDTFLHNCSQNFTAGSFPCLEIRIILKRDLGMYFLQVILPTLITVILSWSVFWGDMDCGSKVALEVVLILTTTAINIGVNQTLPPVSYMKAVDVWCFSCLLMVCAALMECVLISYLSAPSSDSHIERRRGSGENIKYEHRLRKATKINKISRILFPVTFIIFNALYWTVYMTPGEYL